MVCVGGGGGGGGGSTYTCIHECKDADTSFLMYGKNTVELCPSTLRSSIALCGLSSFAVCLLDMRIT